MVWLLRPVGAGMCLYESLKEGRIGLADLANMNDFLDCQAENERRYTDYLKRK